MEIEIERGIPIPQTGYKAKGGVRIAMERMEVGDSIVIPIRIAKGGALATAAKRIGRKFTYRKIDNETARVWRIA